MPSPATDRRTEGLRALARLIAEAVAPVAEAPQTISPELTPRPLRRRGAGPARDGPSHPDGVP